MSISDMNNQFNIVQVALLVVNNEVMLQWLQKCAN